MKNSKKEVLYAAGGEYSTKWTATNKIDANHFNTNAETAFRDLRSLKILLVVLMSFAGLGVYGFFNGTNLGWFITSIVAIVGTAATSMFLWGAIEFSGSNLRKLGRAWGRYRSVAATLDTDDTHSSVERGLEERLRGLGSTVAYHQAYGQKIRARRARREYGRVFDLAKVLGYTFEYGKYLK